MSSPRPVHAIAWFEGRFGYNTHTRGFFEALAALRPVAASPLVGRSRLWLRPQAALPPGPHYRPRYLLLPLFL